MSYTPNERAKFVMIATAVVAGWFIGGFWVAISLVLLLTIGRNHGAGIQVAQDNTRELAEDWIEEYERRTGATFSVAEMFGHNVAQPALF